MAYPAAVESFTTKTNKVDLVDAAHVNSLQTSVVNIETTLGVNPQGSKTDLVTRLSYNISADGSFVHGTSFPVSPRAGDWYFRTDLNVAYVYTGSTWSAQSGITSYAAGDYLIAGPSAIFLTTGSGYTKFAEMYVPRGGTLRTKFGIASGTTAVYGRIYRNGAAVGTEQSVTSNSTWTEFSEDISGWAAGDLLQLYIKDSGGDAGQVGGLRVYESTPNTELFGLGGVGKRSGPLVWKGAGNPMASPKRDLSPLGSIGDLYMDSGGGATTTLYVKTASSTWTAK